MAVKKIFTPGPFVQRVETYEDSTYKKMLEITGQDNELGTSSKTQYEYDLYNNVISESEIDLENPSKSSKSIFKYEYDKNGNWITRVEYNGYDPSTPVRLTERTIEYYSAKFNLIHLILASLVGILFFLIIMFVVKRRKENGVKKGLLIRK